MTPTVTDADVRALLVHRAVTMASEMADPSHPEAAAAVRKVLGADPAGVRAALAGGAR